MNGSHLADLRSELARRNLAGFLVPRADEHLGEYVPPGAERLAWLTGFTGSAGLAIVLPEQACLFVDGRYVLQAAAQTDPALWQRRHITEQPPAAWLAQQVADGAPIGYDPRLMSEEALGRFTQAGLTLSACDDNPIDAVWPERPPPPLDAALPHGLDLAGLAAADKRAQIAADLAREKHDAAVLTDPASICWLLNIRGQDVPFTPFALGFALVHADGAVDLFMDPAKVTPELRTWLGNGVALHSPAALPASLDALAGRRVRVDPGGSPAWFAQRLRAAGATVVAGPDPCLLPKARKNQTEQSGAREAHRRDAVALCRFLHWFATGRPPGLTEMAAIARLNGLRAEQPDFRGESFSAIAAAGPHGAIMHYRVDADSDRVIGEDELFLLDSGAQFACGTTDVTRTLWTGPGAPPDEWRDRFTDVLKGHIAIATLRFPHGVGGAHLDAFARHALWQRGLDFDHGTGHGVGSYLSVHEGPVSLSRLARPVPLEEGMVLSDEPGFYMPGFYGIRLENLLLVREAAVPGERKFLCFETLTLAPFDRRMIRPDSLSPAERAWLDAYHAWVLAEIGPLLEADAAAWLRQVCAPL
jgi:Xaa-Pro aminopeptidase